MDEHFGLWKDCTGTKAFEHVIIKSATAEMVPFPHPTIPCTLVASNTSPGFGPACTQEELITAACPHLLPLGALLIAPPVPPDTVIVAFGHVSLACWQGQGRQAIYLERCIQAHHTFVLADAAELDQSVETSLPDLEPKIVLRDLHKAYTAFSAIAELGIRHILCPLWGAGSFGGNPVVKALILSAAAARAGLTVHLSVDDNRLLETANGQAERLIVVLERLMNNNSDLSVGAAITRLESNVTDILQLRRLFHA